MTGFDNLDLPEVHRVAISDLPSDMERRAEMARKLWSAYDYATMAFNGSLEDLRRYWTGPMATRFSEEAVIVHENLSSMAAVQDSYAHGLPEVAAAMETLRTEIIDLQEEYEEKRREIGAYSHSSSAPPAYAELDQEFDDRARQLLSEADAVYHRYNHGWLGPPPRYDGVLPEQALPKSQYTGTGHGPVAGPVLQSGAAVAPMYTGATQATEASSNVAHKAGPYGGMPRIPVIPPFARPPVTSGPAARPAAPVRFPQRGGGPTGARPPSPPPGRPFSPRQGGAPASRPVTRPVLPNGRGPVAPPPSTPGGQPPPARPGIGPRTFPNGRGPVAPPPGTSSRTAPPGANSRPPTGPSARSATAPTRGSAPAPGGPRSTAGPKGPGTRLPGTGRHSPGPVSRVNQGPRSHIPGAVRPSGRTPWLGPHEPGPVRHRVVRPPRPQHEEPTAAEVPTTAQDPVPEPEPMLSAVSLSRLLAEASPQERERIIAAEAAKLKADGGNRA